jgi:MYXO-CTERM domain-containing protein
MTTGMAGHVKDYGLCIADLIGIAVADLDIDGTGVAESISFGQFITTVPATWDTPWVDLGGLPPSVLLPPVTDVGCSAASGARGGSMAALLGLALAITRRRRR